ncbi:MAG: class I SAM-dependent methyltransferase [Chloroflexi bacterium]|nr:class I SAM-dependent methyltransferase [Chloroflexota bacterium]
MPRERHLIPFVRPDIRGKWLVDLGCGEATTVRRLLDPVQYRYHYVGADLSLNALRLARRRMAGSFVQAATQEPPFRPHSFDALLLLGVLHHLPRHEEHVADLVRDQLKPGGHLLIHEGWLRPGPLPNGLVRRLVPEESEHEDRVSRERLLALVAEQCAIIHVHDEYSPVRTGLVLSLGGLMERSAAVTELVLLADQIVIRTLGRVLPSLAAGAGLVVAQKRP